MSTRLPAAVRRQQLLDIALEVFSRKGFHEASMNDIAVAAGVTKPVLYQHFPSKRGLYLELLREMGDRLGAGVGQATTDAAGPRQQVEAGFAAYFSWVADNRSGFRVLFTGETRHDREFLDEVLRVEAKMAAAIAELIVVDGLSPERQRLMAYGIVGIAEVTARHWLADDLDLDPSDLAAQVAELAWAGLRGLRPS